jgi:hypothetical protein
MHGLKSFSSRKNERRAGIISPRQLNDNMNMLTRLLWLCATLALPVRAADDLRQPYLPGDRARVVVVEDRAALNALKLNPAVIHQMVERGILGFTGQTNVAAAWLSLVSTNDVVGIKVHSSPGRVGGTRPAVVEGVVLGLLSAGLPATNIIIWDKRIADLGTAGYFELAERHEVRIAGAAAAGWDEATYYDNPLLGKLIWGDLEFGRKDGAAGRRSFVTRLITEELTRIINISPMLNHNEARVAGCLFSLASGSVDNFLRFEGDAYRLEIAIPEIYALEAIGDRVALNIVDALLAQYEGGQRTLLHYSAPLSQLRFSRDPVALDLLSAHELSALRKVPLPDNVRTNFTLFNNAALVQLGLNDTNRIDVERVRAPASTP